MLGTPAGATPRHRELPQPRQPGAASAPLDGGSWPCGLVLGDRQPAQLGLLKGQRDEELALVVR